MTPKELENKIDNFATLSDKECALLISTQLLEALESILYIEWRIIAKFMTVPYELRDDLCHLLNSAVRTNKQTIGTFTIGEWIIRYQNKYDSIARSLNTFFEFSMNDSEAKKLTKANKLKLMRVLRMYDYLFITPIFDLDGLAATNILRFTMQPESESQLNFWSATLQSQKTPETKRILLEEMALSRALETYPEVGEQIITSQRIKLKNFPELVRPSLNNWLADYTFTLGYENHEPMKRMEYLFKNPNCLNLTSSDRERLGYILKAFDDKTPIAINTLSKTISFERTAPGNTLSNPENNPTTNFQIPETGISQNSNHSIAPSINQNENVQAADFSFHQKMPFEKETAPKPIAQTFNRDQLVKRNNTIVIPKPQENPTQGKNVINLKDFQ